MAKFRKQYNRPKRLGAKIFRKFPYLIGLVVLFELCSVLNTFFKPNSSVPDDTVDTIESKSDTSQWYFEHYHKTYNNKTGLP